MLRHIILFLEKIIKLILFGSIILFAYSYFQKDVLPGKGEILEKTYQEPIQTRTNAVPFQKEKGGILYDIKPLYNYELYGMIVSQNKSASWLDYYHEKWKDFINIKDICVIWDGNIATEVYKSMEFSSGSWTCYAKFKKNGGAGGGFKVSALSNNHILSADDEINKKIMSVERGDQIYLKGYLVEYSNDKGFKRGTSVVRTDTGNGACETIYVTDFQVLKRANTLYRSIYSFSRSLIITSLLILLLFLFI